MAYPINFYDASNTFWNCFQKSLMINKKGADGKQRILSIIANDFKYKELQEQLLVFINKKQLSFIFYNHLLNLFFLLGFK